MSVLECSRRGCENIMCDRYSREYGYICYDCFRELVRVNPSDIDAFMDTKPNFAEQENVLEKFDKIFRVDDK